MDGHLYHIDYSDFPQFTVNPAQKSVIPRHSATYGAISKDSRFIAVVSLADNKV